MIDWGTKANKGDNWQEMTKEVEHQGSCWKGECARRGTGQGRGHAYKKDKVQERVPWQFSIEVSYVVTSLCIC
jgi:hypothetical protein